MISFAVNSFTSRTNTPTAAPTTRYGSSFSVSYAVTRGKPLTDADMQAIAYAIESKVGSGYGQMVEIFLPPGQDECITPTICFSPDNPGTFVFCAYHHSFNSNIGHTIYSVHPDDAVPGCELDPAPDGQVEDTTKFGLSHEISETISDPDGNAWRNSLSTSFFGAEIGD